MMEFLSDHWGMLVGYGLVSYFSARLGAWRAARLVVRIMREQFAMFQRERAAWVPIEDTTHPRAPAKVTE